MLLYAAKAMLDAIKAMRDAIKALLDAIKAMLDAIKARIDFLKPIIMGVEAAIMLVKAPIVLAEPQLDADKTRRNEVAKIDHRVEEFPRCRCSAHEREGSVPLLPFCLLCMTGP